MNWDMIGHERAAQLLSEHIARGRVRHAYLITGPQGIGRRTLAIRLAQALNCQTAPQPGFFCGTCSTCTRLKRMQHPDLLVIQSVQEGGKLLVDQVREIQRSLSLAPYEAPYKIALFLRFEEAHNSAANALLKTLEEPSERVVLILTASNTDNLPPTIHSRCEVLRLNPVPLQQVCHELNSRWKIPKEQALLLSHLSGGRPGYALQLHDDPVKLETRLSWLDDHARLLRSNRLTRFNYAEALTKDKELSRQTLQTWQALWRDVMLQSAGASAPLVNLDREAEVAELSQKVGFSIAVRSVEAIERALAQLGRNVNTRLAFEVLLLNLPRLD
jgi:DNA polymerase III subunit delta'